MRVKKFVANSINEAVAQMKKEFGSDAVILHTKRIKQGGIFGLFGRVRFEVIGAVDPGDTSVNGEEPPSYPYPKAVQVKASSSSDDLSCHEDQPFAQELPLLLKLLHQQLVAKEIPFEVATSLCKQVLTGLPKEAWGDQDTVRQHLRNYIADLIATVQPWDFRDGRKIVVLVGPTGVGKTTTIAKLAANFALVADKRVGLITMDTYRIAAVDQLKKYADIIRVPLHVVYSPEELEKAIDILRDRDLILIDTAGRSHRNKMQMAELKTCLAKITAEVHLVVSATTRDRDLQEVVQAFSEISIDRLIITKLDESAGYGGLLQAVVRAKVPIAFVTTGQSVPEDIEVAEAAKIAGLILGE